MPLCPQAYLPTEAALLQLLLELDAPRAKQPHPACVRRVQHPYAFRPCFDVAETSEAYELSGELPGLQQHDLDIQFSDAQTLVVRGRTERQGGKASTVPASHPQSEEAAQADEISSLRSHTATVEDDYDEADAPLANPTPASSSTVAPTVAEKAKGADALQVEEEPRAKFWIAERRFGEFARSFTFEQRIEQDLVTASLQNGVLAIAVPKSRKSKNVAVRVL
ncbi:hypothetical protein BUE80_DR009321 [Diplocarpon rosae]|nr:hypothetical protein BUE80_DR009321 [Diplocarpon rosae]